MRYFWTIHYFVGLLCALSAIIAVADESWGFVVYLLVVSSLNCAIGIHNYGDGDG